MAQALTATALARRLQRELARRGRASVARQTQHFFTEPIACRGVRAADVRAVVAPVRRLLRARGNSRVVLEVTERLLASRWLEDRTAALYLVPAFTRQFGPAEFRRTERWLRFVPDWATCDGLCIGVLGPQLVADPTRVARVYTWARARHRWYRRAAAVSLIPATRRGLLTPEVFRLARWLHRDPDDMVQKGVGWLLKETAKKRRRELVRFLLGIRRRAPRLVLRYAAEKFSPAERRRVLG